MSDPDPIDIVEEAAKRPKQASGDYGQYTEHGLKEQLDVAKELAAQELVKRKNPIKISGFVPGSAVGGQR
jgi:hypothetical protein